jgi:hypothetical protein
MTRGEMDAWINLLTAAFIALFLVTLSTPKGLELSPRSQTKFEAEKKASSLKVKPFRPITDAQIRCRAARFCRLKS